MLVERTIDHDPELAEIMVNRLCEFWELVESRTPPEIDGSEATRDVLNRLHPDDNGETVQLDDQYDEMYERRATLKEEIKTRDEAVSEIENKVRLAIGDATFAELPSGRQVTWKTQERKGYYVQPNKFRVMRWK
jgi:predicted phage-related endonuclease